MASSFSAVMLPRASIALALDFRRSRDHHHRIDALLAAGFEQQRHVHNRDRRAGLLGIVEEFLMRGAQHRMHDLLELLHRGGIVHHARRKFGAIDLAVRQSCRETRPRSPAPPRLRRIDGRWRRRRRRERRPPRTALRWWISPSRSSRSVPGSASIAAIFDPVQTASRRSLRRNASNGSSGRPRMVK